MFQSHINHFDHIDTFMLLITSFIASFIKEGLKHKGSGFSLDHTDCSELEMDSITGSVVSAAVSLQEGPGSD